MDPQSWLEPIVYERISKGWPSHQAQHESESESAQIAKTIWPGSGPQSAAPGKLIGKLISPAEDQPSRTMLEDFEDFWYWWTTAVWIYLVCMILYWFSGQWFSDWQISQILPRHNFDSIQFRIKWTIGSICNRQHQMLQHPNILSSIRHSD